jgi:hypothetical protein
MPWEESTIMPLVDDLKDEFKIFKEMGIRGK